MDTGKQQQGSTGPPASLLVMRGPGHLIRFRLCRPKVVGDSLRFAVEAAAVTSSWPPPRNQIPQLYEQLLEILMGKDALLDGMDRTS